MSGIVDRVGRRSDGRSHVHRVVPWFVFTLAVLFVSGAIIIAVHYLTEVNVLVLIVDPAAEVGLAPYVGVFTYIGVLALWSGATVSLLASWLTRRSPDQSSEWRMLTTFGLLLALLAIDDLFLIHEEIGLALAEGLGRPEDRSLLEAPVFAVYAVLIIAWLIVYRETIFRTAYTLLLLGVAALGVSVAIDVGEFVIPDLASATPWMNTTLSVTEELAKLGGIILVTGYAIVTSMDLIERHMEAPGLVAPENGPSRTGEGAARAAR